MDDNITEVAVLFRKTDGRIVRVSTFPEHLKGKITEEDVATYLPGVEDVSDFSMVFVKGKEYLDIDRYRVETDVEGGFVDIVERADVLSPFNEEDTNVNQDLLDREAEIVISVLSVIDDPARLAKYKEIEERGQNRSEVLNFFKQKGV
jgi:hypothetical protein